MDETKELYEKFIGIRILWYNLHLGMTWAFPIAQVGLPEAHVGRVAHCVTLLSNAATT